MEIIILALAAAGVGLYYLIRWGVRHQRRQAQQWRAAREDLGLERTHRATMAGRIEVQRPGAPRPEELSVTIATTVVGKTPMLKFTVGGAALPAFTLSREGVVAAVSKALGGEDVEVGDSTFDGHWRLRGDAAEILAALDAHARQVLMANPKDQFQLKKGTVYRLTNYRVEKDFLVGYARRLTEVASALTIPGSIPERLAHNAEHDPIAGVRRRNLAVLLERFPQSPEADGAVRAALSDEDVAVRLLAARAAGEAGFDVLAALVRDDASVAAEAAKALAEGFSADRAGPLLTAALERSAELAATAARGLRTLGFTPGADALMKALKHHHGSVRLEAAHALAELCDATYEPTLVALLEDDALQEVAAHGLARVGSRGAIAPLLALEERGSGDVRRAAREAVAAIQSRLEGASAGQLSFMADGSAEAGALSPADDPAGALSLEPE